MFYIVTDNTDSKNPKQHIVEAKNKSQALSAIVEPRFSVMPAEPADLIKLSKEGVEVVSAEVSSNGKK